jgi:hypothetical protein
MPAVSHTPVRPENLKQLKLLTLSMGVSILERYLNLPIHRSG